MPSAEPADTSFGFTAGGGLSPASFDLKNGESRTFANLVPRAGYSLAESTPAGWDLTSACSDDSPISNIDVGPGETVTCTFTNTKRGLARVVKTVRGAPPSGSQSFCFDLRSGASTTSAGTVLESQCGTAGNGGLIDFSTTLVPRTTYALCEIVMPGWMTTLVRPSTSSTTRAAATARSARTSGSTRTRRAPSRSTMFRRRVGSRVRLASGRTGRPVRPRKASRSRCSIRRWLPPIPRESPSER